MLGNAGYLVKRRPPRVEDDHVSAHQPPNRPIGDAETLLCEVGPSEPWSLFVMGRRNISEVFEEVVSIIPFH